MVVPLHWYLVVLVAVLLAIPATSTSALTVRTPSSLPQCGLVQIEWTDAVGRCDVAVVDAQTNATLRQFYTQPALTESLTWIPVNVTAGTRIRIYVHDAQTQAASEPVTVQTSDTASCLSPVDDGSVPPTSTRTNRGATQDTPPISTLVSVSGPPSSPSPSLSRSTPASISSTTASSFAAPSASSPAGRPTETAGSGVHANTAAKIAHGGVVAGLVVLGLLIPAVVLVQGL